MAHRSRSLEQPADHAQICEKNRADGRKCRVDLTHSYDPPDISAHPLGEVHEKCTARPLRGPERMAKTLLLHVGMMGETRSFTFERFPVRIGRDSSNECQLAFPKVSRAHARLELHSGRLVLCDEGSAYGTFVRNGTERVAAGGFVDVEQEGGTFWIGPAVLFAELKDVGEDDSTLDAPPRDHDTADDRDGPTHHYTQEHIDPGAVDADAVHHLMSGLLVDAERALATLDPERRAAVLNALGARFSWVAPSARTAADEPSAAAARLALRALRELAEHHLPLSPPLASVEAVAEFATRLDDTLRVLFDGVSALRAAYRSEAKAGETAGAPSKDLASMLLDWTGRPAAPQLEEEFIEMLSHHARLVSEVSELDPEKLESACPARLIRSRWLWREYCRRYRRLMRTGPSETGSFARVRGALGGVEWKTALLWRGEPGLA